MTDDSSTKKCAEERFWERFVDRARTNGVKEPALRWHVRRAEVYLKAFPGKRLGQHTSEDVTGYLKQAPALIASISSKRSGRIST